MPIYLNPLPTFTPGNPTSQTAKWQNVSLPVRFITASQLARHLDLDRTGSNDPGYGGLTDDELYAYIDAAVDYAEQALDASLAPRSIIATFYEHHDVVLPRGPVIGITGVADAAGNAITKYTTETVGRIVRLNVHQGRFPISVSYRAGYTNGAASGDYTTPAIPASIIMAVRTHAATLYGYRESVTDKTLAPVPHSLEAFYRARKRGIGVG